MWLSVDHILQAGGILAVAAIIFAESGLLVGFFLPGDTLLVAAGIFASQEKLNIFILLPAVAIAAILGYQVGYKIGEAAGPRFFKREGGLLLRADYIPRTSDFVARHGGKTMLLARYIAVVRTIVPLVAGIGKMPKVTFTFFNIVGAIIWTVSLTLGAYWLGGKINNVDRFLVLFAIAAIAATTLGELWFIFRSGDSRRKFFHALREEWGYLFRRKD